jgi:hypothetical protein
LPAPAALDELRADLRHGVPQRVVAPCLHGALHLVRAGSRPTQNAPNSEEAALSKPPVTPSALI